MESNSQQSTGFGLLFGFVAGTVVGAGLALWLTPGAASELRDRVAGTAEELGKRVADGYDVARGRVGTAVEDLTRNGNRVRDGVAESMVRGAHEVARIARAAKSDTDRARL